VLQESVGDHGHQRVTMKTLPGSPLKVIKPELLFQLLMRLFANPSCLDGGGQCAQICRGRQVGKIVFSFPPTSCVRRLAKACSPGRCCWPLILDPLGRSVGDPHPNGGKTSFQSTLGPVSPTHICHLASASMSSAGLDRRSGIYRLRGRPRIATGQISLTPTGYTLR